MAALRSSGSSEEPATHLQLHMTSLLRAFDSTCTYSAPSASSKAAAKGYNLFNALHRGFSSTSSLDSSIMCEEDPSTMTIEFLRARLQLQRAEYRAEKQRAQALAHKVVELEKKLSKMEMRLRNRNRNRADKMKVVDPSSGSVVDDEVLQAGNNIDVSLNEEPQLEQDGSDHDFARRHIIASVTSFGGRSQDSPNHANTLMNADHSFSSPGSYSTRCSGCHSSCSSTAQDAEKAQRIRGSPKQSQQQQQQQQRRRRRRRCGRSYCSTSSTSPWGSCVWNVRKANQLSGILRNEQLPHDQSQAAGQWVQYAETSSVVHAGHWRDHEQHNSAPPKVQPRSHAEIVVTEEVDEQVLPYRGLIPRTYQGGRCSAPRPAHAVVDGGAKRPAGRAKSRNHSRLGNGPEIMASQRKFQIPSSSLENHPCCTTGGIIRSRPLGCPKKSRRHLQNIGIGEEEKIHLVAANPVIYHRKEVRNEQNVGLKNSDVKTHETTPVLVNNPLYDTRASEIGYVEIDCSDKGNCAFRVRECMLESKDKPSDCALSKPALPTKPTLKLCVGNHHRESIRDSR